MSLVCAIRMTGSEVFGLLREAENPGMGKSQHRVPLKPQPSKSFAGLFRKGPILWSGGDDGTPIEPLAIPYAPGDLLWVQEAWARTSVAPIIETIDNPWVVYRDGDSRTDFGGPWNPPEQMQREFSRLTLNVTDVRVQRVQEISHDDALAEGVGIFPHSMSAQKRFSQLWDTVNANLDFGWDANPWVVAITFGVQLVHIDTTPRKAAS